MSARRTGLGRGLDALLKREEEEITPGFQTVPIESLRPNRYQPRTQFDDGGLQDLADSIKAQGVVQPLVVSPLENGGYTIVAGERRWRAARLAGLTRVPVVVREIAGDRELLELALVENLQRADLNVMEEAEAYQTLRETFQLSQEEIGDRVGKGRSTVTNTLRLLRLPVPVQDLLRQGRLTAGQARPLLSLPSEEQQLDLARKASQEGWTARKLESLAARPKKSSRAKQPAKPSEIHAVVAAETLTQHLQTKVEISRRGKGGLVRIHFHSEEELMRIYDFLIQKRG